MRFSRERHTEMQIPALFTEEVANSKKKWKERVTQRMWEVGLKGGDQHGDALLLLLLSPIGAAPSVGAQNDTLPHLTRI